MMNKIENHKVIVFGGSGFLGSYVADALLEKGHQVRIFDVNESPYLQDGMEMIKGDIMDLNGVIKACEGCNVVYNFAGLADIDDAINNPLDTVRLNVLGNTHILEGARIAKSERFVFASSIYVYSDSGSFYRASKQASERFVEAYEERYGLSYTILRYGSLYGRRADKRNGMHRLLSGAITEGKIKYPGSGDEIRDYIHVMDATRASVEILSPEYANKHAILTGNEKMKVRDMMHMVSEMLKGKVTIEFSNEQATGHYNITPYVFQPTLGKKLIVNPHIDIGQGILDCLAELHEKMIKD